MIPLGQVKSSHITFSGSPSAIDVREYRRAKDFSLINNFAENVVSRFMDLLVYPRLGSSAIWGGDHNKRGNVIKYFSPSLAI